jgi:uncharacterized repeat protein (TIGR03847 family)
MKETTRMADSFEMNPVSRLTVGTLGKPGNRTFFLQGVHGLESFAVVIEKEQAVALASAVDELLSDLEERLELPPPRPDAVPRADLELQLPVEGRFRASQMGLGYDEESGLVVIAVQELLPPGEGEPAVGRFWATRDQVAALSQHAREIAGQGRPTCALCGQPMDPEGHFCPRTNGHPRD